MRIVETARPPITAIAMGLHISEPCPVLTAIGIIPRMVVMVDINTAYEAFMKSATTAGKDNKQRPDLDPYVEKGYIPLLPIWQ